MEIHQVLASASPGDAVTHAAFGFRKVLRQVGRSEILAYHIDPQLRDEVQALHSYEHRCRPRDLLIYHASIGQSEVASFLLESRSRLALIYHNITPSRYFAPFDPPFAQLLDRGRVEVQLLRDRVELALAVSEYNASELEALGYKDVRVSPLPLDLEGLSKVAPDPRTVERLADLDGPLVLFVGQTLPHKRPDLLVHAHHILTTYLLPDVNLALVGAGRLPRYWRAIHDQALELGLRCLLPGWLRIEELVAFYQAADVFATMSEHEGFCVPLLEAMHFELPVLARGFGAIPDTIAGAGLVLPPAEDPILIAEAMAEMIMDGRLRERLVARGRERVNEFGLDAAEAAFISHLADVA